MFLFPLEPLERNFFKGLSSTLRFPFFPSPVITFLWACFLVLGLFNGITVDVGGLPFREPYIIIFKR
jgi:hypothetical protein